MFNSQFVRSLAVNKIRFGIKIPDPDMDTWETAAAIFMGHQKSGERDVNMLRLAHRGETTINCLRFLCGVMWLSTFT